MVLYSVSLTLLLPVALIAAWFGVSLIWARPRADRSLDLYEAAYLAGGPRRTVNTAMVSLIGQDAVRVARDGTVRPVQGFTPDRGLPVEHAVYQVVRMRRRGQPAARIRRRAGAQIPIQQIAKRLAGERLLLSPAETHRVRRTIGVLKGLAVPAAMVAVLSMTGGVYVVPLVIAVAALATALACAYWLRGRLATPVSAAGRALLARAGAGTLTADGAARSTTDLVPVALRGLTRLPDRDLADALRTDARTPAHSHDRASSCAPGHCGSYTGSYDGAYADGAWLGSSGEDYPARDAAGTGSGGWFRGWFRGGSGGSGGSGNWSRGGGIGGCGGGGGGGCGGGGGGGG
ncbi:TIGR04222 domain-containing membrane protein [Streptosporangium sp. KLBMP 9127]|nr:TIGR04222 domain-containing membrane protein [Streptosporangium sp. KLBMP 9127]